MSTRARARVQQWYLMVSAVSTVLYIPTCFCNLPLYPTPLSCYLGSHCPGRRFPAPTTLLPFYSRETTLLAPTLPLHSSQLHSCLLLTAYCLLEQRRDRLAVVDIANRLCEQGPHSELLDLASSLALVT
jgi:hypothetical protein